MKRTATQIVTLKLNSYLENNAYNKAEVARKAGVKPDDFYQMLTNHKMMTADIFVKVCLALGKVPSEIVEAG